MARKSRDIKVRELIEKLKVCDQNAIVVCADMDMTEHEVQHVIAAEGAVAIG